jgi:antitoxin (DNA-binding transcriptional repressor) of toxin-antitoxin stability system
MELPATEVRRRLLSLLDDLPEEGVVVTKRGKARARLVPVRSRQTGRYVTGPLIPGEGSRGPLCPDTENPYDLLFD